MKSKGRVIAIPPGATIRELMEDRGLGQKELAIRMKLTEEQTSRLLDGRVELTCEIARKLEAALGAPASFWLNLEKIYRESLSQIQREASSKQRA
ncbi:MAG TPA: hypothetical protein PLC26_06040 [Bacillota bacterium]|nr:hypothetical protein [Bacillota bacterium]